MTRPITPFEVLFSGRVSLRASAEVTMRGRFGAREIRHLIRHLELCASFAVEWDQLESPEGVLLHAQLAWLESANVIPLKTA